MSKISIEGKNVVGEYGHLYLVYQDNNGNEFVLRAGPYLDWPPFGAIDAEINIPLG